MTKVTNNQNCENCTNCKFFTEKHQLSVKRYFCNRLHFYIEIKIQNNNIRFFKVISNKKPVSLRNIGIMSNEQYDKWMKRIYGNVGSGLSEIRKCKFKVKLNEKGKKKSKTT